MARRRHAAAKVSIRIAGPSLLRRRSEAATGECDSDTDGRDALATQARALLLAHIIQSTPRHFSLFKRRLGIGVAYLSLEPWTIRTQRVWWIYWIYLR